ncbi:hypothetical protein DERF_002351 [Dermatophagoides farinae]|uniref:beta-N-acetylhexosaminidase n=1 Tax=Dermatophagoides farinae TaxID=6954 RepID=A0A922L9J7_DERFA|nr:hypothetical protein DERF_002351 [Dermatophagoides farinae]
MLLLLLLLLPTIKCHLVSVNPKYPLLEPTLSGPLLWPEPERYLIDKNHQPYRIRLPINFELNNDDEKNRKQLKKCDIIDYNLNKYRYLINNMIEHNKYVVNNDRNCQTETMMMMNDDRKFLNKIEIHIDRIDCDQYPEFVDDTITTTNASSTNHDESYEIKVEAENGKCRIASKTIWGMIRALETFSQLFYMDKQNCMIVIDVVQVWDRPRFRYRSIMIDTARHYLPLWIILQNLDAMAYNKLNILHWHINDDQSFPFKSDLFPNISRLASYSNRHVYTKHDIQNIIKQARIRGIQVIVELNTPAHGHSLAKVFPAIMSGCNNIPVATAAAAAAMETLNNPSSSQKIHSNIINPSCELTYEILEQILNEMHHLFPSNRIHLGMDDVSYECWSNDPNIRQFMGANRMHSFEKLEQYHLERMINITTKLKSKPIIWQDPFDKDIPIPAGTIVQVWKDHRLLDDDPRDWQFHVQKLLRFNHTVILSSCYFLNLIQYGQDWKQIYDCDPHDFDGFDEQQKQKYVIGGEACIWGEYIDQTNFMSRTWPRASAMAERLWSHMNDNSNYDDDVIVHHRLDGHRCRMLARGLPAQPISTGFCEHFDIWPNLMSYSNGEMQTLFDNDFLNNNNNNNNSTKMLQEFLLMAKHEQNMNIEHNYGNNKNHYDDDDDDDVDCSLENNEENNKLIMNHHHHNASDKFTCSLLSPIPLIMIIFYYYVVHLFYL